MKSRVAVFSGLLSICAMLIIASGCGKKDTTSVQKAPDKTEPSAPIFNAAPTPAPVTIPDVIAEVNGEKFTREMADAELNQRLAGAMSQIPPERLQEIKLRMIDQLVERFVVKTLLMAEVKKANITATTEEVEQRFAKVKESLPKGTTFEEIMKKNNITEDRVREDIGADIKISKLFAPVTNGIAITDAEVADYTEKNKEALAFPETVHARHVLVSVAKTDDAKAKADKKTKADKLKEQLDKGADFAVVAKENSDCPSKEMGGDLGKFKKGQMLKPFEDAAFGQATNAIGSIVETEAGYHIIQVLEHQTAGMPSKEEVSNNLKAQKYDEALRKYVASLAQAAQIKNYMPQRMAPPMGMGMPGSGPAPAPAPAPAPDAKH